MDANWAKGYQDIENQQQGLIQQGQQSYNQDIANANKYQGDYNTYTQQASQAQGKVSNYADYLQGAGSGANVYAQQQALANQQIGYNPQAMQQAVKSLAGLQGQLAAANQAFNTQGGVNYAGLTGPAAAQYASSIMSPLQTGITTQGAAVKNLGDVYQLALQQAQQGTGAQLQTQQDVMKQLQNSYADANQQAANAMSQMQYYQTLAKEQQGLNASQMQDFFNARKIYQEAAQASAQASLAMAQAQNQQMKNQQMRNFMNSPMYLDYQKNPNKYNVVQNPDGTIGITLKTTPTPTGTDKTTAASSSKFRVTPAEKYASEGALIGTALPVVGPVLGGLFGSSKLGQRVIGDINTGAGKVVNYLGGLFR